MRLGEYGKPDPSSPDIQLYIVFGGKFPTLTVDRPVVPFYKPIVRPPYAHICSFKNRNVSVLSWFCVSTFVEIELQTCCLSRRLYPVLRDVAGVARMCYVIVTARSLLWTILTLLATLAILSAVLTPKWLIGPLRVKNSENGTVMFSPSVGIYNRCTRLHGRQSCGPFSLHGLATDSQVNLKIIPRQGFNYTDRCAKLVMFSSVSEVFPGWWKAALVFLCLGLTIMVLTVVTSVLSSCIQSVFKKSIFTLSGAAQAVAGICFILGILLYPAGWGSPRVIKLCGVEAAPFYPAECTLGWALYSAVVGVILTFLCSVLSVQAEVATSSDKVQFQIHQGRTLICLP
uniref:Lipoma HMGIC fusion partner-like 2 protein n=1 Tax=Timema monikensis TaxID=170555 RepID=A0A7R9E2P0_9NEOP|nr:unnamed protein product [Timema monikensis]